MTALDATAGAVTRSDASSAVEGPPARGAVEIGRGRRAVAWRLPDGRVAKVFDRSVEPPRILNEFEAARLALGHDVPTWRPHLVEVDGVAPRIVGSFEPGRRLSETLAARPLAGPRLMRRLGALHASIHAIPPETGATWRGPARRAEVEPLTAFLSGDEVARLLASIAAAETGFCHGDLAPKNVLVDGARLTVLDWGAAGSGPMTADVGQTCMIVTAAPFGGLAPIHLQLHWRRILVGAYVGAYCAASGRSPDEIRVFAAASLMRRVARLAPGSRRSALAGEARRWAAALGGSG